MAARKYQRLNDTLLESWRDFDITGTIWDTEVRGLRIRVGKHRCTWTYFAERSFRGDRSTTCKRLGHWPSTSLADARKAALQEAAKIAAGRPEPGRRTAMTVETAVREYVGHLHEVAKRKGKRPTWAKLADTLTRKHLLPKFGKWTLAELSNAPAAVRDWHQSIEHRVSANRCASLLSAAYRNAARLDRSLPPASPISAVRMNKEVAAQTAMPFDQYPAWERAVSALPPLRQAYYRLCLLTGMRGGEAARLRRSDINYGTRSITLRNIKSGADVVIPMSNEIERALKLAPDNSSSELLFPNVKNWHDDIVKGHALRHSWRSVAADLGVNEVHARLLLGHSLVGINQRYITEAVLSGGPGLREEQCRISARITELLGAPLPKLVDATAPNDGRMHIVVQREPNLVVDVVASD